MRAKTMTGAKNGRRNNVMRDGNENCDFGEEEGPVKRAAHRCSR